MMGRVFSGVSQLASVTNEADRVVNFFPLVFHLLFLSFLSFSSTFSSSLSSFTLIFLLPSFILSLLLLCLGPCLPCPPPSHQVLANTRVPASQISLHYHAGFCYLMARRYQDTIRVFSNIIGYILRAKQHFPQDSYQLKQVS